MLQQPSTLCRHAVSVCKPIAVMIVLALATIRGADGQLLPGEIEIDLGDRLVYPSKSPTVAEIAKAVEADQPTAIIVLKLHQDKNNHYAPVWSSDGGSIAFLRSDLTVGTRKTVMQKLGGSAITLYNDRTSFEDLASWCSGPRNLLVFDSNNEPAGRHNVHLTTLDGPPQRITDDSGVVDFPAMHAGPRKNYLVFRRDRELYRAVYEVGTVAAESIDSIGEGEEAYPSPNGKLLAVVRRSELGNTYRLDLREMMGSREKRLHTAEGAIIRNPRFSPDNRYIAFHSRRIDQTDWAIWVVPANGSSPAKSLVSDIRAQEDFRHVGPSWGPKSQGLWYFAGANNQAHYALRFVDIQSGQSIDIDYPSNITSASDVAINPHSDRPLIIFAGHTKKPRDIFAMLLSRSR